MAEIIERGTGTKDDPFLFKNYEEFHYYMDKYDRVIIDSTTQAYRNFYFKFDRSNATTEDIESFDFNKISELGVYNLGGFITHITGEIDFDGLIVKNLYRQNNSIYHNPINNVYHSYFIEGSSSNNGARFCIIRNLKFFNFNLAGGSFIFGTQDYSAYTYFVNCEFSGLIRSDGSSTDLGFADFAIFINCSFNINTKIDSSGIMKNYSIFSQKTNLINCTVRLTGYHKIINTYNEFCLFRDTLVLGTKIFGKIEHYNNYKQPLIIFVTRQITYEGQTINSGPSILDLEIINPSTDLTIYNPSIVVNKSKIDVGEHTLTLSAPSFGMQSDDSTASDYIYNLRNLEDRGFIVAEEVI